MKNFSNLHKIIISLFLFIFSGASIFYQTTCYGAKNPDFLRYYTPLDKKLGENMIRYIGAKHSANWIYKGALYKQFGDVFSMVPDHQTNLIGKNLYITSGYRYQDATNRGAMIVNGQAHIYLAAIAQAATYSHGELQGPPPQLRILVRDPKNLRYLPDIERWAQSQTDMRDYVLTLYNLNCKARNIEQCKMAAPTGAASAPSPAH